MQYRTTRQSRLILDIVRSRRDHLTADQIYMEARSADAHISRGTVYRNLEKLSQAGELLHVKVPGADRFDSRLDAHYHLICTDCGAVFDAPVDYQTDLDREVWEKSGFHVKRHRTVFEGLCHACAAKKKKDP